ncbi:hypothetical protein Dsin_018240 [Dipteronia sinensis]|uniref:Uncharacterized protein n=1 Tax=Dipteronia sinensis TaxID=43782 RepID=A0AAE0E2X2_9ROSI|nr:hypothetical protein Dsin_018240 [Dipteronia sinensis]
MAEALTMAMVAMDLQVKAGMVLVADLQVKVGMVLVADLQVKVGMVLVADLQVKAGMVLVADHQVKAGMVLVAATVVLVEDLEAMDMEVVVMAVALVEEDIVDIRGLYGITTYVVVLYFECDCVCAVYCIGLCAVY